MRSDLSSAALALIASGNAALAQLARFDFPGGRVALNTSVWALTWDSVEYLGAAGLGAISAVEDTPGEIKGLKVALINTDSANIALALDEADQVQGTPFALFTALIDRANYQVVDAPLEWVGACDAMSIEEDGQTANITVSIESGGVGLLRGNLSTMSNADQQELYPGDRGFEFVVSQVGQPLVWPAKEYFYK